MAMGAFGVAAPFISAFLSAFMAGLAAGSWAAGRFCRQRSGGSSGAMLRLYAAAELMIAIFAAAMPAMIAGARRAFDAATASASWDSFGHLAASGACAAALILIPCLCMGATLPLAMAAVRAAGIRDERSFSRLYLANVLGAALGTASCAFALIEIFGFRGVSYLAAAINVLLAAAAFTVSFQVREGRAIPAKTAAARTRGQLDVLAKLAVLGAVSMGMEVIWLRQFVPFMGTTIYVFAEILVVYLLAYAAGSAAYRRWHGFDLNIVWIAAGPAALAAVAFADPYIPIFGMLRPVLGIAPFCVVLGFLTPALVDGWSSGDADRAGTAYAINAAGCVVGPLIAGFVFLPRVSETAALCAFTLPLFVGGAVAARAKRIGGFFAIVTVFSVLWMYSASGYLDYIRGGRGRVDVRRDYQATTAAFGTEDRKQLLVNGITMTALSPTTKAMAHLPLAVLGRPARRALVICFGMGTTFRSLMSWGIPVTAVELVPGVVGLFDYFYDEAAALKSSPRANIVIDDGRRFLARTAEEFDVITIDGAPPMEAVGTSLLYSKAFYARAAARLAPDGILQQWLTGPLEPAILSSFASALRESFPYVRLYRAVEGAGYHCLASRRPIPEASARSLAARLSPAAAADFTELGPGKTPEEQFGLLLKDPQAIAGIIDSRVPALDDDRPINEYYLLRRHFPGLWEPLSRLAWR
jgi:spermidine synthase